MMPCHINGMRGMRPERKLSALMATAVCDDLSPAIYIVSCRLRLAAARLRVT